MPAPLPPPARARARSHHTNTHTHHRILFFSMAPFDLRRLRCPRKLERCKGAELEDTSRTGDCHHISLTTSLLFHGSFRPEKAEIPPQAGKMQGGGAGGHVAITYLSPPSAYACLPVHAPAPAPATRIHTLCSATSYSPQRECTSNRIYVI